MKFTERIPKSPRELELFYRQTVEKLKSTESTLEDVESLVWQLFTRSQQQGMAKELDTLREDLETRFSFIPNQQQEIHSIQRDIEDSRTMQLMRI